MGAVMKEAELYMKNNTLQKRDASEVLDEYTNKIDWKDFKDRVLDIGCGDGSVTVDVLKHHLPGNFKRLLGWDVSEDMVRHANEYHKDNRTEFSVMDIEGLIPGDAMGEFDHVFSFYTLHWIRDQETAFRNIFNLLDKKGDCLLAFLGHMPVYDVYRSMSKDPKWRRYMEDVDKFISPYHDTVEPENVVRKLMQKIGFNSVEVQSREKGFVYDKVETLKKAVTAVNPFKIPAEINEDFLEDYLAIVKEMQLLDQVNNNVDDTERVSIRVNYTLIIAYGSK